MMGARLAGGQELAPLPPVTDWQPYRDDSLEVALASGEAPLPAPMRVAQAPCGPVVCCPQPIFAAPCDPGMMGAPMMAPMAMGYMEQPAYDPSNPALWQWRVLPEGVIWQSYWAGVHEPRISGVAFRQDANGSNLLDVTLGGRASLLRYGTDGPGRPQGLELQAEGAAFPRLNLDENWDLDAVDFRFGLPLVYGRDKWQTKFSYYHLSSHLGDEKIIRDGSFADRINYSRDALALAVSYFPLPAWRWYAEAGWAFHTDVAAPWEFQFGVDVAEPGPTDFWGTPFLAINGHIREEVDFGGNVVAQLGWLWRGNTNHTLRLGAHYFNGKSNQFEFYDQFEEQIGGGLWYDF
jgi:hypothetical protein